MLTWLLPTFPWTLFHQPSGGRLWKTDVWLWILASLIRDLTCWIQPFHESLKYYFDNLYVNSACRSMFLISDKENMLKPFQQSIISEVEMEFSVKNFGLFCSAFCCCISPFSSFSALRIKTFRINVYNKRCYRMYEVIAGIASDTSFYCLY